MAELNEDQLAAINSIQNGNIVKGNVGSGKSRTGIAYYLFKVCKGEVALNGQGTYKEMEEPRDLYIITTAKKRDDLEWEAECAPFGLFKDPSISHTRVNLIIDSWNNIKKYQNVYGAFFIFDEQRLVGNGAWVKAFLDIARKNKWILLTATPGDQWCDYIPVFIANGFYKNKTQFRREHCVYSRYSKYPKIERYVNVKRLTYYRDRITIELKDKRETVRHSIWVIPEYNKELYDIVLKERWNPYDNCPIEECSKWYYLQRQVVNSDPSRIEKLEEIINERKRIILFYNFNYELDLLRSFLQSEGIEYAEWNGQRHDEVPTGKEWVYLVQYTAGSEGWNCIATDTIVFYSQNYSYRTTEQAAGRIDRVNTPYKDLYYYYFRSTAKIDIAIHRKLKDKKKFQEDKKTWDLGIRKNILPYNRERIESDTK